MRLDRLPRFGARCLALALLLLAGLGATPSTEAAPRTKPAPFIVIGGPSQVCLEIPHNKYTVVVVDSQAGYTITGAQVSIANSTGSFAFLTYRGSGGYDYSPKQTGNDQWTITATANGRQPVTKRMNVAVVNCKWTMKFNYDGVFPVKKGFWTATEGATSSDIPLTVDQDGKIAGSGVVVLDIRVQGSAPEVSCAIDQPVLAYAPLTVDGLVQNNTLILNLKFEHQDFGGGGAVTCNVAGSTIAIMHLPLNGNTSILEKLGINTITVPTTGGIPTPLPPARSTGIYWDTPLVGGQGSLTISVERTVETG